MYMYEEELEEEFDENAKWVFTQQMCMCVALDDFGIKTSMPMAKAIMDRFLELMVDHGHLEKREENEK